MDIKIHNCNNNNTILNTKNWVEYTDKTKLALEKQKPKKTTSNPWNGINGVPYRSCPTCDNLLWGGGVFDKKDKHCSNCGQKIDWN